MNWVIGLLATLLLVSVATVVVLAFISTQITDLHRQLQGGGWGWHEVIGLLKDISHKK